MHLFIHKTDAEIYGADEKKNGIHFLNKIRYFKLTERKYSRRIK